MFEFLDVFDFVLKDASGEIKVTGFNEDANKYFDMLQEGKIYYLSNGKIQSVRKPEYNNVSDIFEFPTFPKKNSMLP